MNKKIEIGSVKGFMVDGRTSRMRVYGTDRDLGLDLNQTIPQAVRDAIENLTVVLQNTYGSDSTVLLPGKPVAQIPGVFKAVGYKVQ